MKLFVLTLALVLSGGCLSDATLGLQCENDADCRGGYCTYGVCVTSTPEDSGVDGADTMVVLDCDPGLTQCGAQCVDLRRSAEHCGRCGSACGPGANEEAACFGGECVRECAMGWVDLDGPEVSGCDYECTTVGDGRSDSCDGIDNDCDGLTDDEDPDASSPLCEEQAGVCQGTRQPCVSGLARGCTEQDYALQAPLYQGGDELECDGADNNCDGRVDENCCGGTDDRFEVFGAGESWRAAGFNWRGTELELIAYVDGRMVTLAVGRLSGLEEVSSWEFAPCDFDEFHVAEALDDTVYASCGSQPAGVTSEGRLETLAEASGVESVRVDGGGLGGAEAVLVTYSLTGGVQTTLARDDGTLLVEAFEPPTPHAGPAIAPITDGAVVSFAVPSGEVRLQPVDSQLEPVGLGVLVASPVWTGGGLLETEVVATAADSVVVMWANPGGGVATATWSAGDEAALAGQVLGASRVTRIDAERSQSGVLVSVITEEGLEAWLLDDAGDPVATWSHPLEQTVRSTTLGQRPVRIVTETDGRQLWLAYSAADAPAPSEGLFVIRLGTNSEALCE